MPLYTFGRNYILLTYNHSTVETGRPITAQFHRQKSTNLSTYWEGHNMQTECKMVEEKRMLEDTELERPKWDCG
jgi:hypothetical protein